MQPLIFEGKHIKGCGQAHLHTIQHEPAFGQPMYGTFNVKLSTPFDGNISPTKSLPAPGSGPYNYRKWYWLVVLCKEGKETEAWAMRWEGSRQKKTILELVSPQPIPPHFHEGNLEVRIYRKPD